MYELEHETMTRRDLRSLAWIAGLLLLAFARPALAQTEAWIVGVPIAPPDERMATAVSVDISGVDQSAAAEYFFYDAGERRAYWIQPTPGEATLTWQADPIVGVCSDDPCTSDPVTCEAGGCQVPADCADPDNATCDTLLPTHEQTGSVSWPAPEQRILHVAGAPVDVAPRDPEDPDSPSDDWTFVDIVFPSGAAVQQTSDCENADPALPCLDPDSKIFNRFGSGTAADPVMTVFKYNRGTTLTNTRVAFQVVETVARDDLRVWDEVVQDDVDCTVGSEIETPLVVFPGSHIPRSYHRDLTGKNGYVLNRLAYYDGKTDDPDAAYGRATRSGQIIPVNSRTTEPGNGEPMQVVWYRSREIPPDDTNPAIPVAWPDYPVRYTCEWPASPDRIVIASGTGSEVDGQPELSEALFPGVQLYNQPDPLLPGYNPNDEHALLAPSNTGTASPAVFALRSDLHDHPHVVLKHRKPSNPSEWAYKVYRVFATDPPTYDFAASARAGDRLRPLAPFGTLGACPIDDPGTAALDGTRWTPEGRLGDAHYRDSKGGHWATARGQIRAEYFYPRRADFFPVAGEAPDTCVPWLSGLESDASPVDFLFSSEWPSEAPVLAVGETLTRRVRGLPEIMAAEGVRVVSEFGDGAEDQQRLDAGTLAYLYDPLTARGVPLQDPDDVLRGKLPAELDAISRFGKLIPVANSETGVQLSASIRERLAFDPLAGDDGELTLSGVLDESGVGLPRLTPNVMSLDERQALRDFCCEDSAEDPVWDSSVTALWRKSRNPADLDLDDPPGTDDELLVAFERTDPGEPNQAQPITLTGLPKALSAGLARRTGWLTLAFNDDPSLGSPTELKVIKLGPHDPQVACRPFAGEIRIVPSENIFDEALTLRHIGDFGGEPRFDLDENPSSEDLVFEWWMHPAPKPEPGEFPDEPGASPLWIQFAGGGTAPGAAPNAGQVEVTIDGSVPEIMLSDNYFFVRYKGNPACGTDAWSSWAGAPGNIPRSPFPQLAESWIKRVIRRLNPFDARVRDFHSGPAVSTIASQIAQAGPRYEGDIAFSEDPDNLNDIGLIETYETVFRRGAKLSIDQPTPISSPGVNQSLLFAGSRIADLYMLLGNEAFVDAADPTIAVGTDDADLGSLAPSIFSFQNQLPSLLEEELVLLRGRDDSAGPTAAPPVYNRLIWNFTSGTGQVAYKLNYDITDQDLSGIIDVEDAKTLYPQGHGDAWGHYLAAIKSYYRLLRHPEYGWLPRAEDVLVGNTTVQVDFLDERKFARAAGARAKTGAQILDLVYRKEYVEDPEGQWQGYRDTDAERAWGVDGWARRAAQGAYFDWVTGNAILPSQDLNPQHEGVELIDRQRVTELGDVAGQLGEIQSQMEDVDLGLNPLGLAKGVVPFDINPSLVLPTPTRPEGQTHFEQVYDRALEALRNAVDVWDFANDLTQRLRSTQDNADEFLADSKDRELDFKNRLIEIFGTPYAGDIGPGRTYPAGYDGADLYHWMYVDTRSLTGQAPRPSEALLEIVAKYRPIASYCPVDAAESSEAPDICQGEGAAGGDLHQKYFGDAPNDTVDDPEDPAAGARVVFDVEFPIDPDQEYRFEPPADWGDREAPGELQFALSDLLQSELALQQALLEYDNKLLEILDEADLLDARFDFNAAENTIIKDTNDNVATLNGLIIASEAVRIGANTTSKSVGKAFETTASCLPEETPTVGLAVSPGDVTAPIRCAIQAAGNVSQVVWETIGDSAESATTVMDNYRDDALRRLGFDIRKEEQQFEVQQHLKVLEDLLREEAELRSEIFGAQEVVKQNEGRRRAALAEGLRLLEERVDYRTGVAAATSENRYRDMAFRIFRNDALQKYKAQFDLAARYAYLAATAYDYETNLIGTDNAAGRRFLADIVRHRSLGQVIDDDPVVGTTGLADPLARMGQNFAVLKGQLGFNNPRLETNRFSLRKELFRDLEGESPSAESDADWREILEAHVVEDVCQVAEFRRFARPFAPDSACPQPALVIPFGSTVEFSQNFFGRALGPGDSAFDPTFFATRIRSVGVWFENYDLGQLSNTPRVYLLPVGEDVLRAPTFDDFRTRPWRVVDQALPVPFPIGSTDLQDPGWIPAHDSLSDSFATIRRFSAFRAYHDDGTSELILPEELQTDSRLIGRSVWNTRWILIVPGAFMLTDPGAGLDGFIDSVTDVRVFFETYGYSGN